MYVTKTPSLMHSLVLHGDINHLNEPPGRNDAAANREVGDLHPAPAVPARPDRHPNPSDPHAAVGGRVEAFSEVLDLRLYLGLLHGLGPDAGQRSSVLSGVCPDSPLGGDGFEPSVPRSKESQIFRGDRRYRISQNQ